jgi:predicted AAA+ superfamily ATPase
MYTRNQNFKSLGQNSMFFWGARQTGKSTLLKHVFPDSMLFDLLKTDTFRRLLNNPSELRAQVLASEIKHPIIIDEIQKLPELLNEVHWLIENAGAQFILSGSSPRKILQKGTNLLGGRAFRYELFPLSFSEIPEFDLIKALNHGLLPRHYDAEDVQEYLSAYVGSYLEDEIIAESRIRKAEVFYGFLEKVAFSNGEIVSYTNIASECGVSSPTVKEYFNILKTTMMGSYVESFQKKPKRRTISAPKFYLFDVGIANFLLKRKNIEYGTEAFGQAFEHFIFMELTAYAEYSRKKYPIHYWRTSSQFEVDFVLGDHETIIEVKGTATVLARHLKGIRAFLDEYTVNKKIVVCTEPLPKLIDGVLILPWKVFLEKLWNGEII